MFEEFRRQWPGAIALCEGGSAMLFMPAWPGVYEGHYAHDRAVPLADRKAMTRRAFEALFDTYGARAIIGRVPRDRRDVRILTRAFGFNPIGETLGHAGEPCDLFILTRGDFHGQCLRR